MKAVKVSAFGPPRVLHIEDIAPPRAGSGTAVVAIEAIGLGYMDTMVRRGPSYFSSTPGFVPGYEIAGRVLEAGPDADPTWLGKRVFAVLPKGGGCAEFIELPAEELVPLPGQISFDEAVATGLNALVARIALERLPIGKTDRILVRGAGGGIGLMCVQYARLRGGSIVATTSSRERGERLLALGATSIWNRLEEPDDDARIFELIVDTVMGKEFGAFFDMLTLNGQYLMCGGIGGLPPENFGMKMIEHFHKSPGLHAFSLNSVSADAVKRAAMALFQDVEAKRIAPVIDSILPLSQVVAAHEKLEAGRAFGKVILKPD